MKMILSRPYVDCFYCVPPKKRAADDFFSCANPVIDKEFTPKHECVLGCYSTETRPQPCVVSKLCELLKNFQKLPKNKLNALLAENGIVSSWVDLVVDYYFVTGDEFGLSEDLLIRVLPSDLKK